MKQSKKVFFSHRETKDIILKSHSLPSLGWLTDYFVSLFLES